MKIYNFKNINNCVVCGDINNNLSSFIEIVNNKLPNRKSMSDKVHPKELERQERLKAKSGRDSFFSRDKITPFSKRFRDGESYDSTVIIVAGGCGISSNTSYISKLEEFNKILSDNNCYVLLVRGEMDDPQIFNGEKINMSNVKTIPDYSVVSFKSFNCLCIGGNVSIDRQWKKEQGERIGKKMYWEDEGFRYDEDEMENILEKYDIACIVTNVCPSFAYPGTNAFNNSSWIKNDESVLNDIFNERKMMDKIYQKIMDKNKKPFTWFYSKYKRGNTNTLNDILFISLGLKNFVSFNNMVSHNFGINFEKKLSSNNIILDELISKYKSLSSSLEIDTDVRVDEDRQWDENDDIFDEPIDEDRQIAPIDEDRPIAEEIEYDEPRIYHGIENNVREFLVTNRVAEHLIGTDIVADGPNMFRGGF